MKENFLSESEVKKTIFNLLNEDVAKVKRDEFNRVQYKIEELENSLSETIKQLRKLDDTVPDGLKTVCRGRMSNISESLDEAQKEIVILKNKVRQHKKALYTQQVEEKKK